MSAERLPMAPERVVAIIEDVIQRDVLPAAKDEARHEAQKVIVPLVRGQIQEALRREHRWAWRGTLGRAEFAFRWRAK